MWQAECERWGTGDREGREGHRSIGRGAPKRTGPEWGEAPELTSGAEGHRSIGRGAPKRTGPE